MNKNNKFIFSKKPQTLADTLVLFITSGDYVLFHDQFGEACIVDPKRPFVAWRLRGAEATSLLMKLFWNNFGKSLRADSIKSVVMTLEGIAKFDRECRETYTRIVKINDTIYYDIGDDKHIIKITKDGWKIEENAPVYFRRYIHQKPQVIPVHDGDLKKFTKYVHIDGLTNEILLATYLPTCFISDIDRPLLIMHGPAGAGKTTALEFVRSLIDPSRTPLLQPTKDVNEMVQQANKHYAYFLDNVSSIKQDVSDILCRFVTGNAFSKRVLYTDDDDFLYEFKRVTGFTSISQIATNADLLDRSLIIQLELLNEKTRIEEEKINHAFEQDKPYIFGGLLDAVSGALKTIESLAIEGLPRMADYFRYAAASADYLKYGTDKYIEAYSENTKTQKRETVETSPTIQSILIFMKNEDLWTGTPTSLYMGLKQVAEKFEMLGGFPKGVTYLWRKIQESKAILLSIGINVEKSRTSESRFIKIEKTTSYSNSLDVSIPSMNDFDEVFPLGESNIVEEKTTYLAERDENNQIHVISQKKYVKKV